MSEERDGCEAAAAAMAAGDPDLDPVWGLLIGGAVEQQEEEEEEEEKAGLRPSCAGDAIAGPRSPRLGGQAAADASTSEGGEAEVGSSSGSEACESPGLSARRHQLARSADRSAVRPISNVVDKAEVLPDRFPLPPAVPIPPILCREVAGCDAFVLDGVLSAEESSSLVAQADGLWTFWDDSEQPRVAFRNAHTIEVRHEELAARIWDRVAPFVRPSLVFAEENPDDRFEVDIEGAWRPYAVNPRLLLSRYLRGGHFSPHTDGTTVVDFNRRTFYSCVLFLNASPWGGHTRIYADAQIRKELVPDSEGRLTGDPALVLEEVPPAPGRMLIFYHRLMHEGVPAAEKYIIRTDILYRREPEICTAPEDVEAFGMYQKAQLRAETGECELAADLFRRAFKRSPALRQVYRM